jgi:tRNA-binding protein
METITWADFEKVDMRVGTIIHAYHAEGVNKPAIRLEIDFGELGIKKSSAQLTKRYTPETLEGRKIVAVVNFPSKQIGKFMSECLVLGGVDGMSDVALLSTEKDVPNGWRVA